MAGRSALTVEFDEEVLAPDPVARGQVLSWLTAGLEAVDPERLMADALVTRNDGPVAVIALGKAAPAMCRGAASLLDVVAGICVTDHPDDVPEGIQLMIGDHPVPAEASYAAGRAVLDAVTRLPPSMDLIALISGGGSALCEAPRPGVPPDLLSQAHARLISSAIGIEEINLVRGHLSAIKAGGLAREAGRPIDTFVLSDVGPAGPEVVASGPTIAGRQDPDAALAVLERMSIVIPEQVAHAMRMRLPDPPTPEITVLANGRDAARAVAAAAPGRARVMSGWLRGDLDTCLSTFLDSDRSGVTVAAGEISLSVTGGGAGGRNTHAALLAAHRLGPDDVFCAFATDGVDGRSGAAGAIVDGSSVMRGGNAQTALRRFDSARYLASTSDLLLCPPTGTNVADLWILWRRAASRP